MPGTSFYDQARNNAWSNHRLLAACQQLSHAELIAPRTSFFPGILQTLNHILTVDWYYFDALTGQGRGYSVFEIENPFDDIVQLSVAQRDQDDRIMAFCQSLNDVDAARQIAIERGDGNIVHETVAATLSHLFVHQTHHRGQVHAMLSGTSVKPPQLDEYYLDCDAVFRRGDFEKMGWS
ncbi:MAG: DinB family protein [Pseudomonadota bacterium]